MTATAQLTKVSTEYAPEEYVGQDRSALEAVIRQFFGYELQRRAVMVMLIPSDDSSILIAEDAAAFAGLSGCIVESRFDALVDRVMSWIESQPALRFKMKPQSQQGHTVIGVYR